jgi:hypothetical protein
MRKHQVKQNTQGGLHLNNLTFTYDIGAYKFALTEKVLYGCLTTKCHVYTIRRECKNKMKVLG